MSGLQTRVVSKYGTFCSLVEMQRGGGISVDFSGVHPGPPTDGIETTGVHPADVDT